MVALHRWCDASDEGILVVDTTGAIRLMNARLCAMLKLERVPRTASALARRTEGMSPGLATVLSGNAKETQWGSLSVGSYPPQRLSWQQFPLDVDASHAGTLTIFQDATIRGDLELAKQSFLSMVSHDLRTPLSTILGYAELLYNNRGSLSEPERAEFLQHIIKNANDLSHYTQIALDIMYLEADLQHFDMQPVYLNRFVRHWLDDALHRFPEERLVLHNGLFADPLANVAPAALHKILTILVEFALEESGTHDAVNINLHYDERQAHITFEHHAPDLTAADAVRLFQLMQPRDLSEAGRPVLHRMQLYVASLLAERQHGLLRLRSGGQERYTIDLTLPLAAS